MWTSIVKNIASVFYPNLCAVCAKSLVENETTLCIDCLLQIPTTTFEMNTHNIAFDKFIGRVHIESATSFSYFTQEGMMQKILHQIKYKNRADLGEFVGAFWAQQKPQCFSNIDIIVPVPLSQKRTFERGYNQSKCIADGISSVTNTAVCPHFIVRTKATESQTHKTRLERLENMENAFVAHKFDQLDGKHILLLDDVLTTGATLEACANTLLQAQPNCKLSIASLAVVVQ